MLLEQNDRDGDSEEMVDTCAFILQNSKRANNAMNHITVISDG